MKKSQLKSIIKEVIHEMGRYRRGSRAGSATLENHNIYIEEAEIPGLTQGPTEMEITADIQYDYDPGEPATGMSGPPERSSPGYSAQVTAIQGEASEIHLYPQGGKPTAIDYHNQLTPEQQKVVQGYVDTYVESDSGQKEVQQAVFDELESADSGPDTVDYWDR